MNKVISLLSAALVVLALSTAVFAEEAAVAPAADDAAVTACVDKKAGDAVELAGAEGKMVAATCTEVDGKLVAVVAEAK